MWHHSLPTLHKLVGSNNEDHIDLAGDNENDNITVPVGAVYISAYCPPDEADILLLKLTDGHGVWEAEVTEKLKPPNVSFEQEDYIKTVRDLVDRRSGQQVLVAVKRDKRSRLWLDLEHVLDDEDASVKLCKVQIRRMSDSTRVEMRRLLGDLVSLAKEKMDREASLEHDNKRLRERLTKALKQVDAKASKQDVAVDLLTRKYMHVLNQKKKHIESLKRDVNRLLNPDDAINDNDNDNDDDDTDTENKKQKLFDKRIATKKQGKTTSAASSTSTAKIIKSKAAKGRKPAASTSPSVAGDDVNDYDTSNARVKRKRGRPGASPAVINLDETANTKVKVEVHDDVIDDSSAINNNSKKQRKTARTGAPEEDVKIEQADARTSTQNGQRASRQNKQCASLQNNEVKPPVTTSDGRRPKPTDDGLGLGPLPEGWTYDWSRKNPNKVVYFNMKALKKYSVRPKQAIISTPASADVDDFARQPQSTINSSQQEDDRRMAGRTRARASQASTTSSPTAISRSTRIDVERSSRSSMKTRVQDVLDLGDKDDDVGGLGRKVSLGPRRGGKSTTTTPAAAAVTSGRGNGASSSCSTSKSRKSGGASKSSVPVVRRVVDIEGLDLGEDDDDEDDWL